MHLEARNDGLSEGSILKIGFFSNFHKAYFLRPTGC